METPLTEKLYQLEKFPGKSGWTYALIPEILPAKNKWFNWVKVHGYIDNYEIKSYNLMPMGNGKMFLPVKAEIRKKIGKKEGDFVKIILYADELPIEIPEEFTECLKDEPKAYQNFFLLPENEQKTIIEWIYSAKKDITKVERIAETINKLLTKV